MPKQHLLRYYLVKHLMKDDLKEALAYDLLWLKGQAWR
jgi:hypothetical protein